jgi:hypothetical protein
VLPSGTLHFGSISECRRTRAATEFPHRAIAASKTGDADAAECRVIERGSKA